MRRHLIVFAILLCSTEDVEISEDDYSYFEDPKKLDTLIFEYETKRVGEIEVTCPEGVRCDNGEEIGEDYEVTPEFQSILDGFSKYK